MTSENLVSLYAKALRERFEPLVSAKQPAALVDYPETANCGDQAIWLGEKKLLSDLGALVAYECSAQTYDRDAMAGKLGDGTIFLHGGSSFGDRYPAHHEFRLKLLQDFPRNKVVFFPQQATLLDNEYLE